MAQSLQKMVTPGNFYRPAAQPAKNYFKLNFLAMKNRKTKKANLENKRVLLSEIGFILTLVFVLSAFSIKDYNKRVLSSVLLDDGGTTVEMIPITVQNKKPLPAPPRQVVNIKIVDDKIDIDESFNLDVTADEDDGVTIYQLPAEPEDDVEEDIPFKAPEKMPEFQGGIAALMHYLATNIKYPPYAKEAGIQGRVFINFVVERDGSISTVKVLRGIGGGCDEEAVRVVKAMPKWKPGLQRGKPVRVSFNLPVKFTLK